MKLSSLRLLGLLIVLLLARQGFCAPETLSHFLEANLKNSLVVMEGDRFVDEDRDELTKILRTQTTEKQKIAAIAEKCDYEVQVENGVFLLSKRYSDLMELPCVSIEELTAYARDVARNTAPIYQSNKGKTLTEQFQKLLLSLPEEQWERVKTDLLPVSALNNQGNKVFEAMVLDVYYGDTQRLSDDLAERWEMSGKAKLVLMPAGNSSRMVFKIEGPPLRADTVLYTDALSNEAQCKEAKHTNASLQSNDLQDVLARLNPVGSDSTYSAGKSLLHTPVNVINIEKAEPRLVLKSIAKLFGFRYLSNTTNAKIERQTIAPGDMTDLGSRVANAIPLVLKRSLKRRNYEEATRRLLTPLVAEINKEPKQALAVSSQSRLRQTAVAFNMYERLLTAIQSGARGLPQYIRNTDTLYIKFRRTPGSRFKKGVTFALVREKEGKFQEGLKISSIFDVDRP